MPKKPFLIWVLSTLGVILIIALVVKSMGYSLERPLRSADFAETMTQSWVTAKKVLDCSTYPEQSRSRSDCEDNRANSLFTEYMNLSDVERLSFNCRKLLARGQQKLCVQEKTSIPARQKQTEIMKQLSNGGDISLCDNFSSEKIDQDRCRLDFVMDRFPHPIPKTASWTLTEFQKPEPKDCTIVEKYGLKEHCESEKNMMNHPPKIQSRQ